jgi:hypothetical protein
LNEIKLYFGSSICAGLEQLVTKAKDMAVLFPRAALAFGIWNGEMWKQLDLD